MAFNLTRAAGALAGGLHTKATTASLRAHLISVPARIATSGRRPTLHLPPGLALGNRVATTLRHRHHQAPHPRGSLTIQPQRARPKNPVEKSGSPADPGRPDTETSAPYSKIAGRKAHEFRRWIQAQRSPSMGPR